MIYYDNTNKNRATVGILRSDNVDSDKGYHHE